MKFKKGIIYNPTGKGGFGENPQNRSDGYWSKETSISYQYQFLIRLGVKEFKDWIDKNPESKRTVAQELAYKAVVSARKDLAYLKEVTDRTEGKAVQRNEMSGSLDVGVDEVPEELKKAVHDALIKNITKKPVARKSR